MSELIYENLGLELIKRQNRYFVRYDAGAHLCAWREDELSESEAERLQLGEQEQYEVIIGLQKRIQASGKSPYVQNWDPREES